MKTNASYYLILFVYTSLWVCQVVSGYLTHSLIILTDSYINLYRILDILLGIVHLQTQRQSGCKQAELEADQGISLAGRIFNRICTYQFKRLPVLGSFVNGCFLAALLMSAAIEGIQTCFHASHSNLEGETSILMKHKLTYPCLLIGFALVGAIMQWCSILTHKMREEELQSESLLDLRSDKSTRAAVKELSVEKLEENKDHLKIQLYLPPIFDHEKRNTICLGSRALSFKLNDSDQATKRKFVLNATRHRSFESVPLDYNEKTQISLTSLKVGTNPENSTSANSISNDVSAGEREAQILETHKSTDKWLVIRYCISPLALLTCALIVYFIDNELVTEISDATLAILVVIILFTTSYPPMKKAGKVLLQTAPDCIDIEVLKNSLMSVSPLIVDIKELHVWSLTPRSNRIATCHIVLEQYKIESAKQLSILLRDARFKFLEQNIKCSTIQPVFSDTI